MISAKPLRHDRSASFHMAPARVQPWIARAERLQAQLLSPITANHPLTSLSCLPNTPELQSRIQTFQQRCQTRQISELSGYFPKAWGRWDAMIAIQVYSYFLGLIDLYPDRALVPTPLLDYVWHLHILDTQRYRQDCLALFGQFIDHHPQGAACHLPERPTGSVEETQQLLCHHFGRECCIEIKKLESAPRASILWRSVACGRVLSSLSEKWV